MGFNNTITIISADDKLVEQISSKLVLLRDLDKITSTPLNGALDALGDEIPNVIMLHCYKNNPEVIKLIKDIKKSEIICDTPILFLSEECTRETVIEAFDSGINDLINYPYIDYELLIRTIWCIQENENAYNSRTNLEFIKTLGIIEGDDNIYSKKYGESFIKNEVENLNKHKTDASLMLISKEENTDSLEFTRLIKKSLRLNDKIVIKNDTDYYILLPKTKLNNVYHLFERIKQVIKGYCSVNASVVEIKDKSFGEIKQMLETSLIKAKKDKNSIIVASKTYLKDSNNIGNLKLAKLKNAIEEKRMRSKPSVQYTYQNLEDLHESTITTYSVDSDKMYKRAFSEKCKVVFEPVFEKYRRLVTSKKRAIESHFEINPENIKFIMFKNNFIAYLKITYSGLYKIKIDTSVVQGNAIRTTNSVVMELIHLDFKKLSRMIEELYGEFCRYIKTPN